MRFKKGDKVIHVGPDNELVYKGGVYEVLDTYLEDWIVIVDETGTTDIFRKEYFEHNKNRIVKDILEDL